MNFSKKALIAAAVTGMLPAGVQAAALNENLVTNPSFENVSGNAALSWLGNVTTYAYALNYTGPSPAGGGLNYWFGGGADPLASQMIDITGNAALVDAGQISYNLSAFFSTYLLQRDFGTVRALFLDAGSTQIGSASIGGATFVGNLPVAGPGDLRAWGQDLFSGSIPSGTRMIRIVLDGDKEPGVGNVCDGYIDLLNFRLVAVPEPSTWSLLGVSLLAGRWYFRRRR